MTHGDDVDRWKGELEKVKVREAGWAVPLDVLVGEAVEVAKFVEEHWEGTKERPGLKMAGGRLTRAVAGEILSLRGAVQEAETGYRLIVEPESSKQGLIDRGRFVLNEIEATIEYFASGRQASQ